jgi:hypothetical protein
MTSKIIDGKIIHENHKVPVTRRELLSQGFTSGAGFVLAPSILSLISQKALGVECAGGATESRMTGVIGIDCAGGANFAGSNVIVGKNGTQDLFLPNNGYSGLGVPAAKRVADNVNDEIGLLFHNDSDMLAGIMATTQATTRAKMNGLVFCASSQDDTGSNPHNPMYWIRSTGLTGSLTGLIGTRGSESGANSMAPPTSINPAFRPTQVSSYNQARALVEKGRLEELLPGSADRILKAAQNMSTAQLQKFAAKSMPAQIKELVECGYIQGRDLLTKFNADSVDPNPGRANPDAQIAAAIAVRNSYVNQRGYGRQLNTERALSVAKLVIDGYAGAGTVEIGGCDYHGNPRSVQANKDFEIGEMIGLSIEIAAQKQQNLIVYVYSDGAVSCGNPEQIENDPLGNGRPRFTGDDGSRGSALMFVYRHAGRVELLDTSHQIGSYTDAGRVDTQPVGTNFGDNNVVRLASAFLINYLAFEGLEGNYEKIVGSNLLGNSKNQFIRLAKK